MTQREFDLIMKALNGTGKPCDRCGTLVEVPFYTPNPVTSSLEPGHSRGLCQKCRKEYEDYMNKHFNEFFTFYERKKHERITSED